VRTAGTRSLRRVSRALIVLWLLGGFTLGLLTVYVSQFFVVLLVALQAGVGIGMMRLRCGHCRHPIHMHYVRIAGRPVPYWAPWIAKQCVRCDAEIP